MRTIILVSALCFVPATALAQDARDEEAALEVEPDPIARAAWEPEGEAGAGAAEQDAAGTECDALPRTHDAGARLLDPERALRMVGFAIMDGAR
ncbi:MAG: hypothetical protein HYY06_31425 [Deltaproteobacteria bacterium]|nr:hypothetical protein [Deltaproteobacteria bacterium]